MTPPLSRLLMIAAVLTACADPDRVTSSSSPELSVREARPVKPPTSSITVMSLGALPYSGERSNNGNGLGLNTGSSRSTTRVVGLTAYDVFHMHAMTWTASTGMAPISFSSPTMGWANGVSSNGVIVGTTTGSSSGNQAFAATPTTTAVILPVPAGTTYSEATGVSADGQCIVGFATTPDGTFALLWRNQVLESLGLGRADAISDDCASVTGNIGASGVVWRWVNSSWTVETLPFIDAGRTYADGRVATSEGADLSPSGQFVVGTRRDSTSVYPVVWRRVNGSWTGADLPSPGAHAFGVDNSGRAVGSGPAGPMLWLPSSGSYTAQVLPPLEKSNIGWASAINELGQIAGRSQTRSGQRAVLWTIN